MHSAQLDMKLNISKIKSLLCTVDFFKNPGKTEIILRFFLSFAKMLGEQCHQVIFNSRFSDH